MSTENFKKMEALLYLYPHIDQRIKNINIQIKRLEDDFYDDGLTYGDKSSPTYKISSSTETKAIEYETKKSKYQKEIKQLNEDRELIRNALECLDDREKKYVELKYFSGRKLNRDMIAAEMFQGTTLTSKIRKDAIMKLIKFIF